MPTPFNDLEVPIRLPVEHLNYMAQKSSEFIGMWVDCQNWQYKPSDFREDNQIFPEDLRVFEIIYRMHADGQKYQQVLAEQNAENKAHIKSEQDAFRRSKGIRA